MPHDFALVLNVKFNDKIRRGFLEQDFQMLNLHANFHGRLKVKWCHGHIQTMYTVLLFDGHKGLKYVYYLSLTQFFYYKRPDRPCGYTHGCPASLICLTSLAQRRCAADLLTTTPRWTRLLDHPHSYSAGLLRQVWWRNWSGIINYWVPTQRSSFVNLC